MWFEQNGGRDRIIAKTDLPNEVHVSTVFLGIDHGFGMTEEPVLFETMIFGGPLDGYQDRYTNITDAEVGHERAVEEAKRAK